MEKFQVSGLKFKVISLDFGINLLPMLDHRKAKIGQRKAFSNFQIGSFSNWHIFKLTHYLIISFANCLIAKS